MCYTLEEIREKILPIAKKYHISERYLFGSYARNQATEESDVDLVINSAPIRGLLQLSAFRLEVLDALDAPVDILTLHALEEERDNPIKRDFLCRFAKEKIRIV